MQGYGYKYTGDYKIANKDLGTGTSITLSAYENINDLEGYIILSESNSANAYNYYSIDINGKTKYFMVTSKEAMTGGRCRVNLYQDVLKTWWEEIKKFKVIVQTTVDDRVYQKDAPGNFPLFAYHQVSQFAKHKIKMHGGTEMSPKGYYVLVTIGPKTNMTMADFQEEANRVHENILPPDYNNPDIVG